MYAAVVITNEILASVVLEAKVVAASANAVVVPVAGALTTVGLYIVVQAVVG